MGHFYLARHACFADPPVQGRVGYLRERGQAQAESLATHLPKDAGEIVFEADPACKATASVLSQAMKLPFRQLDNRLDLEVDATKRSTAALNGTIIVGTEQFLLDTLKSAVGKEPTGSRVWGFVGWRTVWTRPEPHADDVKYPCQYTAGQDWCQGHKENWAKWFKMYIDDPAPVSILEIGCWEGLSSIWWLSNVCAHGESELWCVDHFDSMASKQGKERRGKFDFNVGLFAGGSRQRVRVYPFFSHQALSQSILPSGKTFDIVYIDGSHNSIDTLEDALFSWKMLKEGGYMLLDDYQLPTGPNAPPWNPPNNRDINHPKRGIDAFMSLFREESETIHRGYQILLRKTVKPFTNFPIRSHIPIALICDEGYAVGLAVALYSLLETCSRREEVIFFVVDLGLSEETRANVELIAPVHWLECKGERAEVAKLKLIDMLPTSIGQFIYVDADILVLEDICTLWDERPRGEFSAVIDFGFPNGTDRVAGLSNPEDNFPPWDTVSDSFFNAGLFILDLDQVRVHRPHLVEDMLNFARSPTSEEGSDGQLKPPLTCDQDILNLFFRQWTPLDQRWNVQGAGTYAKFRMQEEEGRRRLFSKKRYDLLLAKARIVHFTGGTRLRLCEFDNPYCPMPTKPWSIRCKNPFTERWFEVLDKTPWKNWRPSVDEWIEDVEAQVKEVVEGWTGGCAQVSIHRKTILPSD